jgi:hypothetical protein
VARRAKSASHTPKIAKARWNRKQGPGQSEKGAIEILEEAFHLLRMASMNDLALYYLGSMPFVIGLLYFWGDMSRSAMAESRLAPASLGLAVLFIWMKSWQSVFCQSLTAKLHIQKPPPLGIKRFWRIITAQSLNQATGFIILPLAGIFLIPMPWAMSYYQSVTVLGDGDANRGRPLRREAWEQAKLWPAQNNWMLSILFLFSLFVLANVILAMIQGPQLLKSLLGIETAFTRSGYNAIANTTFWAVVFGITYLLMDPVVKAVYVLRCFYGASITSGLDLKVELSAFKKGHRLAPMLIVAMMLALAPCPASAAQTEDPAVGRAVSPPELSRNIRDVLEQREYSWRLPREKTEIQKQEQKPKGFIGQSLHWLWEKTKAGAKTLKRWWNKFNDWWHSLFPKSTPSKPSTGSGVDWRPATKALLYIALAVVAVILALFIFKYLRSRRPTDVVKAKGLDAVPVDLEDENVVADQKTGDQWLQMARELMDQGDYRLALRALYLANLARLAEHEMIAIARYKTNRDYLTELTRRTPNDEDIRDTFAQNVALFDKVWYGRHMADREDVEAFARRQDHLLNRVMDRFGPSMDAPETGGAHV